MNKPALLVVPFLLAAACIAQDPAKQKPAFVLEPGEIEMTSVIDRCAAYLECNILVSQAELASSGHAATTIRLQQPITADREGCLEFLTTALWRGNLALIWLDDKQKMADVVSLVGPRARELFAKARHATPEEVLARPSLKVAVTTVVPLQHVNATIATNALRPFFASTGAPTGGMSLTLGNVGNNSSMILCGVQDQVAQAIRLLGTVDVPPPPDKTPPSAVERIAELERRVKELENRLSGNTAAGDKPAPEKTAEKK